MAAHWLTFVLLAGAFTLGFYMTGLAMSVLKLKMFSWHKWTGVTVFVLVALRLAYRLAVQPPALLAMPRWEEQAARISHHLLYLFMLAVPLTGWLMSSAKGFQTVYFGKFPIPNLIEKNPPLGEALTAVHVTLAFMLLGVVAVHALAAFKHHFIDKDEVMARMVPGLRPRKES